MSLSPPAAAAATPERRHIRVRGLVQGVGFRPFVHACATELGLAGSVRNDGTGVEIAVEGPPTALDAFARRLRDQPPPLAVVEAVTATAVPYRGERGFRIVASQPVPGPAAPGRAGAGHRTLAPPDVATCDDCLRELTDPADRRYRHPFITCTNCGPRFTIITDLPYDRPVTTMAGFPMCAECAREYADPADRRFHAQPISCPSCGPRLEFVAADGTAVRGDGAALDAARRLLAAGAILAVKGVGGYHLACRASDPAAVARLRERKRRGDKPFAVMAADLATAAALVELDGGELDGAETAALTSPARPIVLARPRPRPWRPAPRLAAAVAPGAPDLGLMLPYTPVHHLLFADPDAAGFGVGPRALVMTSGNLGGEPIAADDADAARRLAHLADGWLRHDRPIHIPCDDSVLRVVDGEPVLLRRSRGYAPLPVPLPAALEPTLAAGGDMKNVCALGSGRTAWLSGHVGDLDDLATLTTLGRAADHLSHLTGVVPRRLAADAHPGYASRAWARQAAAGRPVARVQHHHAHIAAVMADAGLDGSEPVLGFAFDGTGYGPDGAIWGGEALIADYRGFQRFAHLRYVPLPGGDAAVRRPYRMALAHLFAAGIAWDDDLPPVAAATPAERDTLARLLATGTGCVPTSSAGRLFDAVSALLGLCPVADYEARAAIELEGAARAGGPVCALGTGRYRFGLAARPAAGAPLAADAGPVLRSIVTDLRAGAAVEAMAARFHEALVALVVTLAARARLEHRPGAGELGTVALGGGVFANALLLSGTSRALRAAGFDVVRPRRVPPGDGGLALGQLMVAGARPGAGKGSPVDDGED